MYSSHKRGRDKINNNKGRYKIIKSFLPSILLGGVFLALLLLFKPSFPVLLLVVFGMTFLFSLYFKSSIRNCLKNALINTIILTVLHFLFKWLGGLGGAAVLIGLLIIPLLIILRRRKLFIKTLGDIEEEFFGRRFERKTK